MANPFDYVAYDEEASELQKQAKEKFRDILDWSEYCLEDAPRALALVKTKLEEAYMWVGKAIRDDQISRNGSVELQEERNNS